MSAAWWIPVTQQLPDAELSVLIACDTKFHSEPVWIGFHDGEAWREANGEPAFVTHWAQLPAGPADTGPDPLRRLHAAATEVLPQLCDTSTRGLREADELRTALREAEPALGVPGADDWQRPDNTCPRCKQPAFNLFRTKLPGDELDTTHCGCLYRADGVAVPPDQTKPGNTPMGAA